MTTPNIAVSRSRTWNFPRVRLSRHGVGPVVLALLVLVVWWVSSGLSFVIPGPGETLAELGLFAEVGWLQHKLAHPVQDAADLDFKLQQACLNLGIVVRN